MKLTKQALKQIIKEELAKILSEGISEEDAKQYGPPAGIISANPKLVTYIANKARDGDAAYALWAYVKKTPKYKKDIKLCRGGHTCPGSTWQPWARPVKKKATPVEKRRAPLRPQARASKIGQIVNAWGGHTNKQIDFETFKKVLKSWKVPRAAAEQIIKAKTQEEVVSIVKSLGAL